MQTTFVNLEHCVGCHQCEFACAVEHSLSRDPLRAAFEEPLPKPRIFVEAGRWLNSSLPNRCRHCDPAPCEGVCPTGAIAREPQYGLVLLSAGKCINCAMCAMVCPFDVITFQVQRNGGPSRLVATKCDGCIERRARGGLPACVEACKSGALTFGELNELIHAQRQREPLEQEALGTVAPWRSFGQAATAVAEGVSHGYDPSR